MIHKNNVVKGSYVDVLPTLKTKYVFHNEGGSLVGTMGVVNVVGAVSLCRVYVINVGVVLGSGRMMIGITRSKWSQNLIIKGKPTY